MWSEMHCPLNQNLIHEQPGHNFYLSIKGPPEPDIPCGIRCELYEDMDDMEIEIENQIIRFINEHNRTGTGNITEIELDTFRALRSMPGIIAVLWKDNEIVGTMVSLSLRAQYREFEMKTSYTTFLCIHNNYRKQSLAMVLIRSIMKVGYQKYGINHGYYMTLTPHHQIRNEIASWYRPINIKRLNEAHFSLFEPEHGHDRNHKNIKMRQKLWYHIKRPEIIPQRAGSEDDSKIQNILQRGTWYLTQPSADLRKGFEIYYLNNDLFILFPMTSVIASSGKRIRSLVIVLMIGDLFSEALWIAKERGVDLLYGWCGGNLSEARVIQNRGHITISKTYLEFYNTRDPIPNHEMMMPIF